MDEAYDPFRRAQGLAMLAEQLGKQLVVEREANAQLRRWVTDRRPLESRVSPPDRRTGLVAAAVAALVFVVVLGALARGSALTQASGLPAVSLAAAPSVRATGKPLTPVVLVPAGRSVSRELVASWSAAEPPLSRPRTRGPGRKDAVLRGGD